jgi:HSP90 family molecular chaperone
MFEILGNEIYQGDPYVFLRELLQNSIDAIRMRREILRKHAKIEPGNLGVIRVNVEHLENKDIIVTWSDDGIGMDEYIIQNYLAVAGKSYYRSPDFEKVGLEMDPISRFGIGILSCFIVANHVEIETYKDPNLLPRSEPLKITIPDQSKQFRVEILPEGCSEIGTTVRVFVESRKITNCDENNHIDNLDVTEYLSIIAGFVEFPIMVPRYFMWVD